MNNYEIETDEYIAYGLNIFQSELFAESERDHAIIYKHYTSVKGLVVDMGCGIGEMGALLELGDDSVSVINVTNSNRQVELMQKLGRNCVLSDFHNTEIKSGIADTVMFNESFGYGDCDRLASESARLLKTGGSLLIKDFSPVKELDATIDMDSWDYVVHPVSKIINSCEIAGLKMIWAFHPSTFRDRAENFFKTSKMNQWHDSINTGCITILIKFTKV